MSPGRPRVGSWSPATPISATPSSALPIRSGLAEFYLQLLGWVYRDEDHASDDTWVVIKPPGWWLRAVVPARDGARAAHLADLARHPADAAPPRLGVQDLEAEVARAEGLGARRAEWQPQDDVRVMLDPAGHPFCLFAPGG